MLIILLYSSLYNIFNYQRPRGKESTEVRITQNKGKERKTLEKRQTQTHGNYIIIDDH